MLDVPAIAAGAGVLKVRVSGERLAMLATDVTEIVRPSRLTRLPRAPACLLGVTSLHGAVLPVVSLARMLGHEGSPSEAMARIVVVQASGNVGVLVDEVCGLGGAAGHRMVDICALIARHFVPAPPRMATRRAEADLSRPAQARGQTAEMALIVLNVADQDYGLPLSLVSQVAEIPPDIIQVPGSDGVMAGVMTLRGRPIPLASLRALLGLPPGRGATTARIVVTRVGGALVGLVVDAVVGLARVKTNAIDPVPSILTRGKGEARVEAICRIDDGRRLVAILSPARLFDAETTARLAADTEAEAVIGHEASEAAERFVVFLLGDEYYALPIASVGEVVRRPDSLTRMPHGGAIVQGVMNLRGRMLPVIDPRRQLDVATGAERPTAGLLMVVTGEGRQAIFAVDAVTELLSVAASELQPAPACRATMPEGIFDRVAVLERDGRIILVIDPGPLLALTERGLSAGSVLSS